ncbi:MAG: amidohydrolase [Spirochaetales bacterium]|nr:amidohydrolase [Spirochaetales bacterium]
MTLIKNGKIISAAGKDYDRGDILIEGKLIKEIGTDLQAPEGTEVIDAEGSWVLPGFVDPHTHLGLFGQGLPMTEKDVNEGTDPITPHLRGLDGINPQDASFRDALEGGVTTVASGPGSMNVIGGQFCVIKTHGIAIDEMLLKEPLAMKCAFGENVKKTYAERKQTPMTRMGNAALLREALYRAREYGERKNNNGIDCIRYIPYDIKMEALLPVLRGEIPLKIHAHRADDILTAIRIAKEFDLKLTLDHCTEGHLIPQQVAASGAPAILGPTMGFQGKFELKNKSFTTPAVLHEAGVLVALMTDHPEIPIQHLNLCAALAEKAGLPFEEAIKAITINAAKILGLDDRIGSLEPGKDADLVLWTGNPLEISSEVRQTIINGKPVYTR